MKFNDEQRLKHYHITQHGDNRNLQLIHFTKKRILIVLLLGGVFYGLLNEIDNTFAAELRKYVVMQDDTTQKDITTQDDDTTKNDIAAQNGIATQGSIEITNDVTTKNDMTTQDDDDTGYTQEELEKEQEKLLQDLDLNEIESVVDELLGEETFSFSKFISDLISGEQVLDGQAVITMLRQVFYGEMLEQKDILMQLFLLIIIAAFLLNLSKVFESGQISETAFYVVYLIIFALLIKSFENMSTHVKEMLSGTVSFMQVLTPAYYLATVAAEGTVSAGGYYQVVLIVLFLVQWLLMKFIIPAIHIFVLVGIVNLMSKEEFLSKMAELVKTIIDWVLKSMIALVVGMQVLQRMVSPAVDQLQRGIIGKAASALPGVGNAIDSVTEMILGCAILVRNCLGAAALVVLILLAAGPAIQLAVTTMMYRLLAAVAQPISDKRLLNTLTVMSDGFGLLLRVLLTAEAMFLVSIAIVASGI